MELFTVAIRTYQQRHHLEKCLDSVFLQNYRAIELIVCDDDSCDFYVDEVEAYIYTHKPDNIVSVTVQKQPYYAGEAKTCQAALELAHGTYITFLKADEEFSDERALLHAVSRFKKTNGRVIVSRRLPISEDGRWKGDICPCDGDFQMLKKNSPDWFFVQFGTHPCEPFLCFAPAYFQKDYLTGIGFETAYASIPFWALWLKISRSREKIVLLDEVTVYQRQYVIEDDMAYMAFGMKERHYNDCIRLLQDYVSPRLCEYTLTDRIRCRYAIESIKITMDDRKWYTWKLRKKFFWKIRKAPVLLLRYFYQLRTGGCSIHVQNEVKLCLLLSLLFYLDVPLFLDRPSGFLWAAGSVAVFAVLAVKVLIRLGVCVIRAGLDKRMKGKVV